MQPLKAAGAKPGALEPTKGGLAGGKARGPPRSKFKLKQGPPQCPQQAGKDICRGQGHSWDPCGAHLLPGWAALVLLLACSGLQW